MSDKPAFLAICKLATGLIHTVSHYYEYSIHMFYRNTSNKLYGVAIGVKQVGYQPGAIKDRPCMVVLVQNVLDAEKNLRQDIVVRVITVINSNSSKKYVYKVEGDPFWLKFIYHRSEFLSEAQPLIFNSVIEDNENPNSTHQSPISTPENSIEESDSSGEESNDSNDTLPLVPGSQISTKDGTHGTLGLFLRANIGKTVEYFGITCAQVCFDYHLCIKNGTDTRKLLNECWPKGVKIDKLNEQDYEEAMTNMSNTDRSLILLSKLGKSWVYQLPITNGTQPDCAIGRFAYILHGLLLPSNASESTNLPQSLCTKCKNISQEELNVTFLDMGLVSLTEKNFLCDMPSVDEKSSWQCLRLDEDFLPFGSTVYTFNVRDSPPYSENGKSGIASCIKECSRKATIDYIGSPSIQNDNGDIIDLTPHLRMSSLDDENARLFAAPGDSGSILYQKSTDGKYNLIIGILSAAYSHQTAYGFFLQPALDIIMSRLFLAHAQFKLRNNPQNEFLKQAVKNFPKGLTIDKQGLKIGDLEYMYSLCINTTHAPKPSCILKRRCTCRKP